MKDTLKFRGEVIARNKTTGEILFKQHNCIVEGGRLMTLAKAMGLTNGNLTRLNEAIDNPSLKQWFTSAEVGSGDYSIMYFKAGYDTTETGLSKPLSVNTQAIDITTTTNPWYVNEVDFFTKAESRVMTKDDIPVEYYDENQSYSWDNDVVQPIINKASTFDTIFLRYKLNLEMPIPSNTVSPESVDDIHVMGWHNVDSAAPFVTVNELGLFMSSDAEKDSKDWLMFSLLKFPPITLQAEMKVEFEYRIYG